MFDYISGAACFSAAAQVSLLTADWPASVAGVGAERGIDGRFTPHPYQRAGTLASFARACVGLPCDLAHLCRYTFRGPRVAMAVHSSSDWEGTYTLTSGSGSSMPRSARATTKSPSSGFAIRSDTAAAVALPVVRTLQRPQASHAQALQSEKNAARQETKRLMVGAVVVHPRHGAGVINEIDAANERGKTIHVEYSSGESIKYSSSSASKLQLADDVTSSLYSRRSEGHLHALSLQMIYTGTAVELARTLAKCAWGGQIILTEAAWEEIRDSLPSGTHVLSLGLHTVDGSSPMALMELVPNGLSGRNFASLQSGENSEGQGRPHVERLTPGYRDSPDPDMEMAIAFVSTHVPAAEEPTVRKAVELFSDRVRGLLNVYGGYECKEPEPGKFTLSFGTFQGAVRFSAALHLQLLDACWPAELLRFPCCGNEYDDEGGLIYRGLRARIGIAFSKPTARKPLSSGRAGAWQ